jgi:hypothetical protein
MLLDTTVRARRHLGCELEINSLSLPAVCFFFSGLMLTRRKHTNLQVKQTEPFTLWFETEGQYAHSAVCADA